MTLQTLASAAATPAAPLRLAAGPMEVSISDGRLRIHWSGAEVVREIDCPIRDADWRTLGVEETGLDARETAQGFILHRRFRTTDGTIEGDLAVEATAEGEGAGLVATLLLTPIRPIEVNRAGFVLLHPIVGVAGTPLAVLHPDGRREAAAFPARISPGQPVRDIAGLRHRTGGAEIALDLEGEIFEMEDQRNWTDASFKTYCRPLSRPRPYHLEPGEHVRQVIRLHLRPSGPTPTAPRAAAPTEAIMPHILLAHDPELGGSIGETTLLAIDGLLLRLAAGAALPALPPGLPVTLELVTDAAPRDEIAGVAAACREANLVPRRVVALPRSYLASHQPEGPWPEGPAPMDLVPLLRAAFPGTAVGGGMLTNFTEFNRCPPDPAAIDFATFGTTAIVHAADDRAVAETLEALPDVFASARALVPGRPLHLGLVSIGMRSNPYGSAVAPNPEHARVAMAMDDPRQREPFAAAFAIAAAAAAAGAGVASFAPAMATGPLGLGPAAAPWPIRQAVAALAALGGAPVRIEHGPTGVVAIHGAGRGLAANLGPEPAEIAGRRIPACGFATWETPA